MTPITYFIGDATQPHGQGRKIIAHIVNDIGAWGAGFVLALSKRSRAPELAYKQWFAQRDHNDFALGSVQFVEFATDVEVANMIGQHGIASRATRAATPPVCYDAIERALEIVAARALETGACVHLPRIGCGLAGGTWDEIEPILARQLNTRDVAAFVYVPPSV